MAEEEYGNQFEPVSIGERLRQAREAKGLSLEDVANQTRIPIRHLQHIDREEWDALPAITYCIGFVRSYATVGRPRRRRAGPRAARPDRRRSDPRAGRRILSAGRPRPRAAALARPDRRHHPRRPAHRASPSGAARSTARTSRPPRSPCRCPRRRRRTPQPGPPQPAQPQAVAGQPVTLVATEEVWLRIDDGAGGPALFQGIMAPGQRFDVPPTAQSPTDPHRPAAGAANPDRRPRHRPDRAGRAHRRQRQPEGRGPGRATAGRSGSPAPPPAAAAPAPAHTSIISVA